MEFTIVAPCLVIAMALAPVEFPTSLFDGRHVFCTWRLNYSATPHSLIGRTAKDGRQGHG